MRNNHSIVHIAGAAVAELGALGRYTPYENTTHS